MGLKVGTQLRGRWLFQLLLPAVHDLNSKMRAPILPN